MTYLHSTSRFGLSALAAGLLLTFLGTLVGPATTTQAAADIANAPPMREKSKFGTYSVRVQYGGSSQGTQI